MLSSYPSACCLFCPAVFGNSNSAPSHLQKHLKTQHLNHQNKSKVFFEASLHNKKKQVSLLQSEVKGENKDLVLAFLKMVHIVIKRKRPYTELESVVLPCLEIAADILHGGKTAVSKVKKIFLSDNTTKGKCDNMCCVKVGISATAQSTFDKLNEFLEEHDLDWTK